MKRPWQFSLSSLLLAMIVLSIVAALFARFGVNGIGFILAGCALAGAILGAAGHNNRWMLACLFCFVLMSVGLVTVSTAVWDGYKTVPLRFVVVDAASQSPIATANVRLRQNILFPPPTTIPSGENGLSGTTISDGSVALPWDFPASGHEGICWRSGVVFLNECLWIQASAPGYETQLIWLQSRTGGSRDISDPIPPPMRISLVPKTASK